MQQRDPHIQTALGNVFLDKQDQGVYLAELAEIERYEEFYPAMCIQMLEGTYSTHRRLPSSESSTIKTLYVDQNLTVQEICEKKNIPYSRKFSDLITRTYPKSAQRKETIKEQIPLIAELYKTRPLDEVRKILHIPENSTYEKRLREEVRKGS